MTVAAPAACLPAFDLSLRLLAAGGGLAVRARTVLRTRDIVFADFRPEWLASNLKFDLSLSAGGASEPSVRFSYNNFGESDAFRRKVESVFASFKDGYDLKALGRVLDAMQPTTQRHQTTLGFEWGATSDSPRIKVYFEELHHAYSLEERRSLARAVAHAAGGPVGRVPQESIAAIAVDFFPDGRCDVKFYSLFRTFEELLALPEVGEATAAIWRTSLSGLSRESRAFYYLTRRMSGGRIRSLKLYKIYEFAQFADFTPARREIAELLVRWGCGVDLRRIEQLEALCRKNGGKLYPVIASVDVGPVGLLKVDTYFSIRASGAARSSHVGAG